MRQGGFENVVSDLIDLVFLMFGPMFGLLCSDHGTFGPYMERFRGLWQVSNKYQCRLFDTFYFLKRINE